MQERAELCDPFRGCQCVLTTRHFGYVLFFLRLREIGQEHKVGVVTAEAVHGIPCVTFYVGGRASFPCNCSL